MKNATDMTENGPATRILPRLVNRYYYIAAISSGGLRRLLDTIDIACLQHTAARIERRASASRPAATFAQFRRFGPLIDDVDDMSSPFTERHGQMAASPRPRRHYAARPATIADDYSGHDFPVKKLREA